MGRQIVTQKDINREREENQPVDPMVIHCTWGQYSYSDTDCGKWQTDCGQDFCFIGGGPKDNLMQFCCYCGKPLREEPYKDEYKDSEEE